MSALRPALLSLVLFAIAAAPGLAQSGSFGTSVIVSGDELIIAEPNNTFRPGTVYVYRRGANGWEEAAQLRAPEAERADGFGTALARTGNTLVVAQRGGSLHSFLKDGMAWRFSGTLEATGVTDVDPGCSQYGYCGTDFGIALAAEGDWLLVGSPGPAPRPQGRRGRGGPPQELGPGVVHVFQRTGEGMWTQHSRLVPSDGGRDGDRFGAAIALANGRALIGAPNWSTSGEEAIEGAGRVVEFRLENGSWQEVGALPSRPESEASFGAAIAMDEAVAVIGAPGSSEGHGAAFLYQRDPETGAWNEGSRLVAFSGLRGDRFGSAVGITGEEVWVGAPAPRGNDSGMVYLYRGGLDEGILSTTQRVQADEALARDAFGDRIAGAEGTMTVSATGMHHEAGAVYVYEQGANGEWSEGEMLVSPPDALAPVVGEERLCEDGRIGPFDCDEIELLAFVPGSMLREGVDARGVRTNDNWGWTDPETGREYALVGRNDGTSFVDITDPVNPVLVGDLPKTPNTPRSQLWRDIKVYRDHAYIVADGAGDHGMQVFDLRRLREVSDPPALFEPDLLYTNVASVHNIAINEETGFAYLVGSGGGGESCGGGLHMIDIREPKNPTFVNCFRDERGTHDVQCLVYQGPDEDYQGHEICLMANGNAFAIADVTDKANPVALSRASSPGAAYIHQGWVTEDHAYFLMDDESDVIAGNVPTTRTLVWDLSDLEDPVLALEFMGSMPASAHNLYVKGDLTYQANYRYGLHILDTSDPLNPREVGFFDTSPYQEGPGFSGAWSNYPFFESGTIIVTSLQEGLFVLRKRRPISE